MIQDASVWPAAPRQTAQVRFADGQTFEGTAGTPLARFVEAAYPHAPYPIVAALVNGELEELTYVVTRDVEVRPIDISTHDGLRIYQRSLTFLLAVAVRELFPQTRIMVDHAVTFGGLFCQIIGRAPLAADEVAALEAHMRAIVAANEPIVKERITVQEAATTFAAQGYDDKVRLLAYREQEEIAVYSLRGIRDYFYGYMMPSTGGMRAFSLHGLPDGLILRMPRRPSPQTLTPVRDYPKLTAVFREYGHWLQILGIGDMGALNAAVESGDIRRAVLVSEALHEKRIAEIANNVIAQSGRVRLVLIAGPSSSGKTTFARRLAIQLMVGGVRPYAVSLDDYFVDRERTPRDEQGGYDFEALEAIDLALFNQQLAALMAGEMVRLPRYNFITGQREPGDHVRLAPDTVIIVEGIHGLNPNLITSIPTEAAYRIYISALTQLNIDHHNRVPTTDTRLLRRIVRDAQYRGHSARDTIERWDSVVRGEERNIFPYQENADMMFNSALVYELAVLKPLAEPLLLRVPRDTIESLEARRLLAFLQWVRPCPSDLVPDNSILREFIGGSILQNVQL